MVYLVNTVVVDRGLLVVSAGNEVSSCQGIFEDIYVLITEVSS
jgi:hypothetical protein